MFKNTVKSLLENGLNERPDLFLIDFKVLEDNSIKVVIDGDKGVLVEDCMFISRAIEHNLDREEQDFSLEVTSAGASEPFTQIRQYKKNIGRTISITTLDDQNYEAKLEEANESYIDLKWKSREPKPIGKGKITVIKEAKINYKDIKEAKVKIKF